MVSPCFVALLRVVLAGRDGAHYSGADAPKTHGVPDLPRLALIACGVRG